MEPVDAGRLQRFNLDAPSNFWESTGASRGELLDRWLSLTRVVLPGMASAHEWPIRLDHCFMRICLGAAIGTRWDAIVQRPAVRHLSNAQLARAVAIAGRIASDPVLLGPLNQASLRMRGKRQAG